MAQIDSNSIEELSHDLLNGIVSIQGSFRAIEKELRRMKKAIKDYQEENGIKETNKTT